jgi:hypothetical protein
VEEEVSEWFWVAVVIGATLIGLLLVLSWAGRDRGTRRVRMGFFFDREAETAHQSNPPVSTTADREEGTGPILDPPVDPDIS